MPTYTYRCKACNHEYRYVREIARRDAPIRCPSCGTDDVSERKLEAPAVNMNGQEAAK
jgi:putative FmdB family regulatory protein